MQPQILVPFDFSPSSQRALAWAADMQRTTGGSPVHVIHIVVSPGTVVRGLAVPHVSASDVEAVAKVLRAAVHRFEVAASTEVIAATSVGKAILASATHLKAGLIVMGTQGRNGLHRLVLGSVAEHVVQHAACPVVLMRSAEVDERPLRARS